ncbi:hypothetical protein Hanom_Chr17g01540231 [Helianthus anomalus]
MEFLTYQTSLMGLKSVTVATLGHQEDEMAPLLKEEPVAVKSKLPGLLFDTFLTMLLLPFLCWFNVHE